MWCRISILELIFSYRYPSLLTAGNRNSAVTFFTWNHLSVSVCWNVVLFVHIKIIYWSYLFFSALSVCPCLIIQYDFPILFLLLKSIACVLWHKIIK
jgi:hypothetical protein